MPAKLNPSMFLLSGHNEGRSSDPDAAHAHAARYLFHDVLADALGHFLVILFALQLLHLNRNAVNVI